MSTRLPTCPRCGSTIALKTGKCIDSKCPTKRGTK